MYPNLASSFVIHQHQSLDPYSTALSLLTPSLNCIKIGQVSLSTQVSVSRTLFKTILNSKTDPLSHLADEQPGYIRCVPVFSSLAAQARAQGG